MFRSISPYSTRLARCASDEWEAHVTYDANQTSVALMRLSGINESTRTRAHLCSLPHLTLNTPLEHWRLDLRGQVLLGRLLYVANVAPAFYLLLTSL